MKKRPSISLFLCFLLMGSLLPGNAHALKVFGFGSNKYDVIFRGTPLSVHAMIPGDRVDAIEGSLEDGGSRDIVVFKIGRVTMGEFQKQRRGGPSRFDQMTDAMRNKEVLDVVTFDFKNPEDQIDRETIRIAVKDSGATFGLTPGQEIAYFEHKIYLKQISTKPEAFLFVKSEPVKASER